MIVTGTVVKPDRGVNRSHPVSPPEFPKVRSAVEPLEPRGFRGLWHAHLEWRLPFASHVVRRLLARACPRLCLRIVLANGQTSTDSDLAARPGLTDLTVFGCGIRSEDGGPCGPSHAPLFKPAVATFKGRSQQRKAVLITAGPR